MEVVSKSSTLRIKQLNELKLESKRDKYYIDEIKTLNGTTSFSFINIDGFSNKLELETEYGEINIDNQGSSFKLISLSSKYTDVNLDVINNFSCTLNIDHSESSDIQYPDVLAGIKTEEVDKKEDHFRTSGRIGQSPNPSGKINIRLWSGSFMIRFK